jgi:hypothetical protein
LPGRHSAAPTGSGLLTGALVLSVASTMWCGGMTRVVSVMAFFLLRSIGYRLPYFSARQISTSIALLSGALIVELTTPEHVQAQNEPPAARAVIIRHEGPIPYEESRIVPVGEPVLSIAGRLYTGNELDLRRGSQGAHEHEQSTELQSGADGLIVELREPAVLSVYAGILERNHGASAGKRSLSMSESRQLEQQYARTMREQDFVLNRLALMTSGGGAGQSRASNAVSAPITRFNQAINGFVLRNVPLDEVLGVIRTDPELMSRVKRVVANQPLHASLTTSVKQINAPEVWTLPSSEGIPLTGSGVKIGILDTGVDYRHPDLGGCYGPGCKVAGGYDFINDDNDPIDDHGHGTHCAATAAGDGSYVDSDGVKKPLQGVAPGATIYSYKVLSQSGSGSTGGIIKALEYCTDPNQDNDFSDRLDVCSLSLGGYGNPDDVLSLAVDAASRAGVVVVVAAGNSGPSESTISSPGTARLAITVAAGCKPGATTGSCGSGPIATFSSRGPIPNFPQVMKPDIVAPGVDICAARYPSFAVGNECLDGTRVAISGTSMATPHVAGVAALLRQAHPGLSPEAIKEALLSSATDLGQPRESQGAGLVDAHKALQELGIPNPIGRLDGAPVSFEIEPLQTIAEASRTVTLTSRLNVPIDFVASLETDQVGVQLTVTPQQASLAPGESATFTLRAIIDLNKVASGKRWRGRLRFASTKGDLESGVYGLVKDRLRVDADSIDLGIKNGDDVTWKDGKTLRLRNVLGDTSTTYKVSVTCCGIGNNLTSPGFSASAGESSVEIPPNGTVDIPLSVEATGAKVENGLYRGLLTLSSDLQTVSLPIRFYKGWLFRYTYRAGEVPIAAALHSKNRVMYDFPENGAHESVFLVKESGPWQAEALFESARSYGETEVIFKTDQTAVQATHTIPFNKSEANKMVLVRPRHPNGSGIENGMGLVSLNNYLGTPHLHWFISGSGEGAVFRAWINTFAPGIRVEASSYDINDSTITTWQHVAFGDSRAGDVVLRDGTFLTRYISPASHNTPRDATKVLPYACAGGECWRLVSTPASIPAGEVGILHASTHVAASPEDPVFVELPRTYFETVPASQDESDSTGPGRHSGGYWYVSSAGAYAQVYSSWDEPWFSRRYSKERTTVVGYERGLGLGAGPEAYVGSWFNYPGEISYLKSWYGSIASSYVRSGGATTIWNSLASREVSYSLLRNDVEIRSGSMFSNDVLFDFFHPGDYKTVLKKTTHISGVRLQTESSNSFVVVTRDEHEASPHDQNPPTLKHLALVADGLVQDALDPSKPTTLYFGINPVPGFLRPSTTKSELGYDLMDDGILSLQVEQSLNGVDWSPLAHETISTGEYKVAIPVAGVTGISKYRITASDLAGNTFTHTFELPTGSSLVIPTSTPTPNGTDTPTSPGTPTPSATPTPESSPTFESTPTAGPTVSATPDVGSNDSRAMLPKARASVKNGKWFVSIPRIAAMNMDVERASALNKLFAAGLTSEEVAKYSDLTKFSGECLLSFKRGKRQRQRPLSISYLRGRRVPLSIPSRVRTLRILYSCRFYSAKPYSLLLGPTRQSPEITAGRVSRGRKRRLVARN